MEGRRAVEDYKTYGIHQFFKVIHEKTQIIMLCVGSGVSKKDLAGRLARWSLQLQGLGIVIVYGSSRLHADGLSRHPIGPQETESEIPTLLLPVLAFWNFQDGSGKFWWWMRMCHHQYFAHTIARGTASFTDESTRLQTDVNVLSRKHLQSQHIVSAAKSSRTTTSYRLIWSDPPIHLCKKYRWRRFIETMARKRDGSHRGNSANLSIGGLRSTSDFWDPNSIFMENECTTYQDLMQIVRISDWTLCLFQSGSTDWLLPEIRVAARADVISQLEDTKKTGPAPPSFLLILNTDLSLPKSVQDRKDRSQLNNLNFLSYISGWRWRQRGHFWAHQEKYVGLIKRLSGVFGLLFASGCVTYTFRHQIVTMGLWKQKIMWAVLPADVALGNSPKFRSTDNCQFIQPPFVANKKNALLLVISLWFIALFGWSLVIQYPPRN